jgi:hypothetical protein
MDDDVFPPSNCWIALLLAMTGDLLLALTASVKVFTCFYIGSRSVSVELAGGETFMTWSGPLLLSPFLPHWQEGGGWPESGYAYYLPIPPFASYHALASSLLVVVIQAGMMKEGRPPCTLYSTSSEAPLSMHSCNSSRRQVVTGQVVGGILQTAW